MTYKNLKSKDSYRNDIHTHINKEMKQEYIYVSFPLRGFSFTPDTVKI